MLIEGVVMLVLALTMIVVISCFVRCAEELIVTKKIGMESLRSLVMSVIVFMLLGATFMFVELTIQPATDYYEPQHFDYLGK